MSTHRQQQQNDQEKKHTWFSRRNVVIATIVIVALLITTAWILSILNVIPATWATIITAVLTVATAVFTLVAAFPSLFGSEKPEQHTTSSSTSQVQHIPDSSILSRSCCPAGHRRASTTHESQDYPAASERGPGNLCATHPGRHDRCCAYRHRRRGKIHACRPCL